ncbi:MAG: hypothetical protein KBT53_11175 [Porticoccus sp.]|nr:hypothetical protein [Porticoccus sp.]MBQ0806935.1 hypothetical protein [Porticoccus sp.]
MGENMKKLFLLLFLVCAACSSEKRGLAELKRLCEKDAGLTIYKTVEADGYYNTTGRIDLVNSQYRFFEYCDESPSQFDSIPVPGCYRLTKVNRDSGQCHDGIDQSLSRFIVEPYPEFLEQYCIAVKKIDKPEARYAYNEQLDIWLANNKHSEFIRTEVFVEDRASQEVLGQYISYSYNVRPRHSSPKSCRLLDKKFSASIKADLIEKTIVIHKEK